jgi:hypothetical protein
MRTALSKTAICSRSCRHTVSMGQTTAAESSRSASRTSTRRSNGSPRIVPGSIPNVCTPRIWFDRRVVMPTSCALAPSSARLSMGIERFHVHRPIPSRAHNLCELLGIVLIGLVHLHLERYTGMSRIEADHVQPSLAQLKYEPGRHRAGFNCNAGIISRMRSQHPLDLLRIGWTLATPEPATRIVNQADRSYSSWPWPPCDPVRR